MCKHRLRHNRRGNIPPSLRAKKIDLIISLGSQRREEEEGGKKDGRRPSQCHRIYFPAGERQHWWGSRGAQVRRRRATVHLCMQRRRLPHKKTPHTRGVNQRGGSIISHRSDYRGLSACTPSPTPNTHPPLTAPVGASGIAAVVRREWGGGV